MKFHEIYVAWEYVFPREHILDIRDEYNIRSSRLFELTQKLIVLPLQEARGSTVTDIFNIYYCSVSDRLCDGNKWQSLVWISP
jgi:hypothetical protein